MTRNCLKQPLVSFLSKGCFFLLLFFFLTNSTTAQINVDSLKKTLDYRPKLTGGLFSRYTFIDGFQRPVYGIKGGLDFNNTIRVGAGVAKLKWPYEKPNAVYKDIVFTKGTYSFLYYQVYLEYVFHQDKRWEFSMPLNLGLGRLKSRYYKGSLLSIEQNNLLLIYEPVVACHYKVIPWFAFGADVGFRFLATKNKKATGVQFNSPVYAFKTIIFWGKLYEMYIKKN